MILALPFLLVLSFLPISLLGQYRLSENSEISILTLGPDQAEVFSAFWHSGIRVRDPQNKLDYFYNYGIFDFDNPNFYTDFAKGYLLYRLGAAPFDSFFAYYVNADRSVEEQILNLTQEQKQAMFEFLEYNNLPENRQYFYNYLFNNCATKIRDVVVMILGDKLQFDGTYLTKQSSFRQLIDECTEYQPWGDFGIDLGLGSKIDRIATPYEHMFLPYYVRDAFANAVIHSDEGVIPLVKEQKVLFAPKAVAIPKTILTPDLVLWLLFGLVVLSTFWSGSKLRPSLDVTLFAVVGLVGLGVALIWFATDHVLAADNYNLIWMNPLHLLAVPFLFLNRKPRFISFYFLINGILMAGLILTWFWLPQELHWACFPLILSLGLRSFRIYKYTAVPPQFAISKK